MNGILWRIQYVDQNSSKLVDRTGTLRVATTDPKTRCVYLSDRLSESFRVRVLIHELGHCAMVSFNLLYDIHKIVRPEFWVDAEEWVCNFIADYGFKIFKVAENILGDDVWDFVSQEIERLVA